MATQEIDDAQYSIDPESADRTVIYSARAQSGPLSLLRDLREGFRHGPIWRVFAWDEIQNRYRRSVLGLAWIGVSYLFFVFVIVLFFRGFASMGPDYFLSYVALGYAAFMFLIGNVTEGCLVFRTSATWIRSAPLPYSIYVFKGLSRAFFTFAIHALLAVCVMFWFGWRPSWQALAVIPAIGAYLINAVWVQYLFGLLGARWRDFGHLMTTVTRLMFFASPIIWVYGDTTGIRRNVADINPFTHFLDIFRAPLIGEPYIDASWLVVLGWTVIGWTVTIIVGGAMRRRLPFWV